MGLFFAGDTCLDGDPVTLTEFTAKLGFLISVGVVVAAWVVLLLSPCDFCIDEEFCCRLLIYCIVFTNFIFCDQLVVYRGGTK